MYYKSDCFFSQMPGDERLHAVKPSEALKKSIILDQYCICKIVIATTI